ncbi:proto-oncogene tyrosine-protein kinase receptor Ret-like, partial [Oculina patagonica]
AENEYETITEILEVHFNHGHSIEDEKGTGPGYPVTQNVPGSTSVYDHLYEQPIGPGSKPCKNVKETSFIDKLGKENGELKSGLGMFSNHYSHLGESPSGRRNPLPETRFIVPPTPKWEISRDRLKIKRTIGHGEFGLVKKGCALNVSKLGGWIMVAVKTLKEDANESHRKDLLSELQVMKGLAPHKHVIELLACITKSEPLCVITEFAPYGDLLGFLRKKRGLKDNYYDIEHLPKRNLTSRQLMKFAWEIADGMAYLSSVKIIHRDLAARNILLGENLTCKVTDFGMARDIHGQDMYQKNSGGRLPVKWTAIEALIHGRYTTKSDVWSFGVVLFEIVTIGGCPYPGMDVLELIEKLESGYRMEKPRHLHDEVYAVMRSCWHEDPDKRLSFRQLHKALNKLDKEIQDCINLKKYDGNLYEDFHIPPK